MMYLEYASILRALLDDFQGEGLILIDLRRPGAMAAMEWLLSEPEP